MINYRKSAGSADDGMPAAPEAKVGTQTMPHFYLDLHNGIENVPDEDGSDYPNQTAARVAAIKSIRSIVSEEAIAGSLDLTGSIEICDENRNRLLQVFFTDAFDLKTPVPRKAF